MKKDIKIVLVDRVLEGEMTSEISSHLRKIDSLYPSGLDDLSLREKEKLVEFIYKSLTNKDLEDVSKVKYIHIGAYTYSLYENRNISNPNKIGRNYLDRTIYYKNDDGLNTIFALRGSYLSNDMMKEALELEEKYIDLNTQLRNQIKQSFFLNWKSKESDINRFKIINKNEQKYTHSE